MLEKNLDLRMLFVASAIALVGCATEPELGAVAQHSEPVFDEPACQEDPSLPPVCERYECRYLDQCRDEDLENGLSGDSGGSGPADQANWEECIYADPPVPPTPTPTPIIFVDALARTESRTMLDTIEEPPPPPPPPSVDWVLCDEYSADPMLADNPRPAQQRRPKESKCTVVSASGTIFPGTFSDTGTSTYSKSVANGKIAKGTATWWQTHGGGSWEWWRGLGWARRLLFGGHLINSKAGIKCFAKKIGADLSCVAERNINDYYTKWGIAYNDWSAIDGTLYWLGSDSAFKDPGVAISSDLEVGISAGIAVDVVNVALGTIGFTAQGATPTWSVTNKRNYLAYHRMTVNCDWEDGKPPANANVGAADAHTGAIVEDDGGAGSNSPPNTPPPPGGGMP